MRGQDQRPPVPTPQAHTRAALTCREIEACWFVSWVLKVKAACKCNSATDLLRQFYVLDSSYVLPLKINPYNPDVANHIINQISQLPYNPDVANHVINQISQLPYNPDVVNHIINQISQLPYNPDVVNHVINQINQLPYNPDVVNHVINQINQLP